MDAADRLDWEARRLAALRRYDILDTEREPQFDEIAALAAEICGTPIGVVNLIDEHRQFFKAEVGLGQSLVSGALLRRRSVMRPMLVAQ